MLLKTNESKQSSYGLKDIPNWLKFNPFLVPILMMNLSRLGWPPPPPPPPGLWYPLLIFAWLGFAKFHVEIILAIIRCGYMLTINTSTLYERPFLNVFFNLVVNEYDFSVPAERNRFLTSHDIILHVSFHWHHKCHYEKLEHVIVMIAWSGNANIDGKTTSGGNHMM